MFPNNNHEYREPCKRGTRETLRLAAIWIWHLGSGHLRQDFGPRCALRNAGESNAGLSKNQNQEIPKRRRSVLHMFCSVPTNLHAPKRESNLPMRFSHLRA